VRSLAVAAALVGAAVLPDGRLGIGVVVVAVLMAVAAALARPPDRSTAVFGALALALASFAAIRDADWLVSIDLLAAWVVASIAVAGVQPTGLAAPIARLREVQTLTPPAPPGLGPAVRGALLGGFLVVPFVALFAAADAAFAELGGRVPLPSPDSLPLRLLVFVVISLAALGLGLAARRPPEPAEQRPRPRLHTLEWAIPLLLLDALFAAFVAVQLTMLFGGHDHVLRTAGLTYAEYAREGFWELLTVAGLTLAVVASSVVLANTPTRVSRLLLRALLGLLCALTLVVVGSAIHRLQLYEDAFGLTRLRLAAEVSALWLGGAFTLVLLAGLVPYVRLRVPSLAVGGTAVALIAFSAANPDGLIASRNVEHWRETGQIDLTYLDGLSADAVPVLSELPATMRRRALARVSARLARGDPWGSANLARSRARAELRPAR
jgi:Domain of unknown function (DUF4173)